MSRFLALIVASAVALFIAGPAMAALTVTKTVDNSNTADTTFTTDVTVTKDVDIEVDGDLDATGGIAVQGDVVFKEIDVNVQDQENVVKFFELDDSASSKWVIDGLNGMNALEQLQNGEDNFADISQLATPSGGGSEDQMNVGLQYQVGFSNSAKITQTAAGWQQPSGTVDTNNFAKQIQIGTLNGAEIVQNKR